MAFGINALIVPLHNYKKKKTRRTIKKVIVQKGLKFTAPLNLVPHLASFCRFSGNQALTGELRIAAKLCEFANTLELSCGPPPCQLPAGW
jgi:hypothetical protein